MILRMWHGRTARTKADAYEAFLIGHAIPDYRSVPGNLDVSILAKYHPENQDYLLELEPQVQHYTVAAWA